MWASRASIVNADSWYCNSVATRHITPSKHYLLSYTKFANPETIVLGKKIVLMQAYGDGMINVQMFHNGRWHDAILKTYGRFQMQAHIYSPSKQPPKTATAQT